MPTSLPFATAMAGRHIKFELPRPSKNARIDADSNIQAWLLRVDEYVTISGIDPSAWALWPVTFLTRTLWHCGRHAKLSSLSNLRYCMHGLTRSSLTLTRLSLLHVLCIPMLTLLLLLQLNASSLRQAWLVRLQLPSGLVTQLRISPSLTLRAYWQSLYLPSSPPG